MSLSATFIVQVIAALTIPLIFIGFYFRLQSIKKSFTWKQTKMALTLSMAPILAILAVRELVVGWMAIGSILLTLGFAFVMSATGRD